MCLMPKFPTASAARTKIAAYDNADATRQAALETSLRRRRTGAAANILTSASGIPSTPTLGGVAA